MKPIKERAMLKRHDNAKKGAKREKLHQSKRLSSERYGSHNDTLGYNDTWGYNDCPKMSSDRYPKFEVMVNEYSYADDIATEVIDYLYKADSACNGTCDEFERGCILEAIYNKTVDSLEEITIDTVMKNNCPMMPEFCSFLDSGIDLDTFDYSICETEMPSVESFHVDHYEIYEWSSVYDVNYNLEMLLKASSELCSVDREPECSDREKLCLVAYAYVETVDRFLEEFEDKAEEKLTDECYYGASMDFCSVLDWDDDDDDYDWDEYYDGYDDGYSSGIWGGFYDALNGYNGTDGYYSSYNDPYSQGYDEGYNWGYTEGQRMAKDAYEQGYRDGYNDNKDNSDNNDNNDNDDWNHEGRYYGDWYYEDRYWGDWNYDLLP